ncbi:hypothetical protein GCM10027597_63740 [Saccharopolyspora tripterygii]
MLVRSVLADVDHHGVPVEQRFRALALVIAPTAGFLRQHPNHLHPHRATSPALALGTIPAGVLVRTPAEIARSDRVICAKTCAGVVVPLRIRRR